MDSSSFEGSVRVALVTASVAICIAATLASCSGGSDQTPAAGTGNPLAAAATLTPSAAATRAADSATPTPLFVPKKLADAEYVPTSFEAMAENLNKAFDAHPEFTSLTYEGGRQTTKEEMYFHLNRCKDGAADVPVPIWKLRMHQCSSLVNASLIVYKKLYYEEFYQVAVDAANYFNTEIPSQRSSFDNSLQAFSHDSSPALP